MSSNTGLFSKFCRSALGISAAFFILIYFFIAVSRIRFPFELEWMEGACVDHVNRILQGKKLYVEPSIDFVPFQYTPVYFYVSALTAKLTGIGFLPLRLVSLVSSFSCFFLIFLIVRKETGNNFSALLSAGLFAATFHISGGWFDLGRVDSLFLASLLLVLYLFPRAISIRKTILMGMLVAVPVFIKQTALVFVLPLILYSIIRSRKNGLILAGTVCFTLLLSSFLLDSIHDGWFLYYVFGRQLPLEPRMFVEFWTIDLALQLPVACAMSAIYFSGIFRTREKGRTLFYAFSTVAMFGCSWIARVHNGGYLNVLMPAYAMISILFGLSLHELISGTDTSDSRGMKKYIPAGIYAITFLQFTLLVYSPFQHIPSASDLNAGNQLVKKIAAVEGEVLIPYHGFLTSMAGKKSYAHYMAIVDLIVSGDSWASAKLVKETSQAIQEKKFGAILLDRTWFEKEMAKHYILTGHCFTDPAVFWPREGTKTRPESIYLPSGN
jgi:hypothetical protein